MFLFTESWYYLMTAAVLSAVLVPLMRPLAFQLGAVDRGTGRRVHSGIIPRLGGVGIFLAFLIPASFSLTQSPWDATHDLYLGLLMGSLVIFLVGLYDDIKGARVSHKLLAETMAAMIIYAWGIRIDFITSPFGGRIELGLIGLPVTVLWIVIITNAVNLIDGLDGLAAGSAICIAATFLIMSGANMEHLQIICIILIGALAGFLIYNFPPASIFMGDSGSLFVGFILGALSIRHSMKATALATVMVPVIAFSLPLMDMAYAIVRRYYRGIPLDTADKEHIHHKLLEKGLSKARVLIILYMINIAIMLFALIMVRQHRNGIFLGIVGLTVFAMAGVRFFGYLNFIPFVKDMKRSFELNRKRKYNNFVIRQFVHHAAKTVSLNELKPYLAHVLKLYRFSSVRITVFAYDPDVPFLKVGKDPIEDNENRLVIRVPILSGGTLYGFMDLTREMDGDCLLCSFQLFNAVSEAIVRAVNFDRALETDSLLQGHAESRV